MRYRTLLRPVLFALLCVTGHSIVAQANGFNLVIQETYRLPGSGRYAEKGLSIGIGYQHDFEQRIGMGVDVNYAPEAGDAGQQAFEVIYSSKYFTSPNASTAFYVGPFIGYQRVSTYVIENGPGSAGSYRSSFIRLDLDRTHVPIGLRSGVRGGLAGYFAEAFVAAGYNIGHGELYNGSAGSLSTAPWTLTLGFSFIGMGWE
ncbi:MAG: hypothetical protein JNM91_00520 [Flavobacteriales bacterium]|nr:hypothetical protein [Flavobacteriales bacterium]